MDNGKEVPVSRLRSKEFSGVVLQDSECKIPLPEAI